MLISPVHQFALFAIEQLFLCLCINHFIPSHFLNQSLTRTVMNIAQLAGPIIGGALYEVGGFKMPFIIMGSIQTVMAFIALPLLPDYDSKFYL